MAEPTCRVRVPSERGRVLAEGGPDHVRRGDEAAHVPRRAHPGVPAAAKLRGQVPRHLLLALRPRRRDLPRANDRAHSRLPPVHSALPRPRPAATARNGRLLPSRPPGRGAAAAHDSRRGLCRLQAPRDPPNRRGGSPPPLGRLCPLQESQGRLVAGAPPRRVRGVDAGRVQQPQPHGRRIRAETREVADPARPPGHVRHHGDPHRSGPSGAAHPDHG
mmetsp:Transcript_31415/g.53719  ORF Transcript_31415/g.53719 Transcript_31415/m.53719 type:complete len:218 (+) Transcript_31415:584-1237(+)